MLSFWEKNSFLNYDFIIIGSGILGLSTACEIKERDSEKTVLVLEKGIFPTGASTRNAGFACFGSLTEILSNLERIGENETISLVEKRYEGIKILRKRLGDNKTGYLNYGGYELIDRKHFPSVEKIDFVNNKLTRIFRKSAFEIKNEKIKDFGFDEEIVKSLVYSPYESQIDTGKMMSSLIEYSTSLGIKIINGCKVTSVDDNEKCVRVAVDTGDNREKIYFSCRSAIICTNAFTPGIFPEMDIVPARGQVLITKPVMELKFKGVFHFDEGFYYFRNYENRIIFGGGRNLEFEKETTTEFESNNKIINDLKEKLDNMILPGQKYEIDYTWSGIMGFNYSKEPEIKKISDKITFALSCNGMGIALSPYVAREIVKLLEV